MRNLTFHWKDLWTSVSHYLEVLNGLRLCIWCFMLKHDRSRALFSLLYSKSQQPSTEIQCGIKYRKHVKNMNNNTCHSFKMYWCWQLNHKLFVIQANSSTTTGTQRKTCKQSRCLTAIRLLWNPITFLKLLYYSEGDTYVQKKKTEQPVLLWTSELNAVSCSNWFCVKSQPRLFHLGKPGALMKQTISCCMNLTIKDSLFPDPMVTCEDVWLNAFAKSFLFKKGRRDWDEYTWNQKVFEPRRFSDVSAKTEFTVQSFHQTVLCSWN